MRSFVQRQTRTVPLPGGEFIRQIRAVLVGIREVAKSIAASRPWFHEAVELLYVGRIVLRELWSELSCVGLCIEQN